MNIACSGSKGTVWTTLCSHDLELDEGHEDIVLPFNNQWLLFFSYHIKALKRQRCLILSRLMNYLYNY